MDILGLLLLTVITIPTELFIAPHFTGKNTEAEVLWPRGWRAEPLLESIGLVGFVIAHKAGGLFEVILPEIEMQIVGLDVK